MKTTKAAVARTLAWAQLLAIAVPAAAGDDGFAAAADSVYRIELTRASRSGALDRDPALLERSRRIFASLVASAAHQQRGTATWEWEIHTTEDPVVAAYCLAGGKVMLGAPFARRLALDDAELAMLVAHEIAHAVAGHKRTRDTSSTDADPAEGLKAAALAMAQEREADSLGMAIAHRAGWPLAGLVGFFDKLAALEPAGSFNSTHGRAAERASEARRIAAALER